MKASAKKTTEKLRCKGDRLLKFGASTGAVRKGVGRFIGNFFRLPVRYCWTAKPEKVKELPRERERLGPDSGSFETGFDKIAATSRAEFASADYSSVGSNSKNALNSSSEWTM